MVSQLTVDITRCCLVTREGAGRREIKTERDTHTLTEHGRTEKQHKGRRCFSFVFTFSAIGSLGCFGLLFSISACKIFDYPGIKHQNLKCN